MDLSLRTVELGGERYVILPERQFQALVPLISPSDEPDDESGPMFDDFEPLEIPGPPASEMIIEDRNR